MAVQKKLSPRKQRLLVRIGGLGLVIFGLYGGFIIWPLLAKVAECRTKIQAASQDLAALRIVAGRQQQLQSQHKQLRGSVKTWHSRLPGAGNISTVIENVSQSATDSGLKILIILPMEMQASTPAAGSQSQKAAPAGAGAKLPYRTIPLQMEAIGNYRQLMKMVQLLESSNAPMKVISLRVVPSEKDPYRHHIHLHIQAFVAEVEAGPSGKSGVGTSPS